MRILNKGPVPFPKWEDADAYALQAMDRGDATAEQQQRALKWIVYGVCDYNGFCDHPENDRLSAIHEGRRFVGSQIIKLISINMEVFKSKARSASSNLTQTEE